MNKLLSILRVNEIGATAAELGVLWSGEQDLQNDKALKAAFAEIADLQAKITTAVNSGKAESRLEAADDARDAEIRSLQAVLEGYAANKLPELSAAGAALQKVFAKYGAKIARENYSAESNLIESLLEDLGAALLQSSLAALPGVQEGVAALRAAQSEFAAAEAEFDKAKAADKQKVSATALKKPLLAAINEKLVAYLNTMRAIDGEKFGAFAAQVESAIARGNSLVSQRSKGSEGER